MMPEERIDVRREKNEIPKKIREAYNTLSDNFELLRPFSSDTSMTIDFPTSTKFRV